MTGCFGEFLHDKCWATETSPQRFFPPDIAIETSHRRHSPPAAFDEELHRLWQRESATLGLLLLYFLLHLVQFTDQLLCLLAQFGEPVRQRGFALHAGCRV